MKQQKSRTLNANLFYWIPTVLASLNWSFGGVSSLLGTPTSMEVFDRLGYPAYFAMMLGTAQILGVIAILFPVNRTLREWAYAGLTFDAIAAIISLLAIGSPVIHITFPVMGLALILTSYRAWRLRIRKTEGTI